jgi:hypothetical protein
MWVAAVLLPAALGAQFRVQQSPKSAVIAPTVEDAQSATTQQDPQAAQQNEGQAKIRVPVNLVIVPVIVKDGAGRIVPDLRKDEFRILEDKVEQKIQRGGVSALDGRAD